MPGLLGAIQTKVDALKKHHALPAGAADALSGLKQTWGDASASFQSGDLSGATEKASAAKAKLADIQQMLGMKAASSQVECGAMTRPVLAAALLEEPASLSRIEKTPDVMICPADIG